MEENKYAVYEKSIAKLEEDFRARRSKVWQAMMGQTLNGMNDDYQIIRSVARRDGLPMPDIISKVDALERAISEFQCAIVKIEI
jgi:DNA polymerase III delta prime subunit